MKKAMILLLSAICAMMMGIASPTPVQASSTDYETWDGECISTLDKDGFTLRITKKRDEAKKINGEAWIEAAPALKLSGSVTIPKLIKEQDKDKTGYNIVGICANGFYWQDEITSVEIEADIKEIGKEAFYHCENLKEINLPSSLRYIGGSAFSGAGLIEVTIPKKVKVIKEGTFEGCSSLTKVTMKKSVTRIEDRTFQSCAKLKTAILSKKLKTIGAYAFSECSALTSITLPKSLKSIGDYCFRSCSNLKSLTIPSGVTSISDHMCYGCTKLEKVVMSDTVTAISEGTFMSCSALTDINLPSKLKKIGRDAFGGSGLKRITFPKSLRTIGPYAFTGCDNLSEAIIPEGVTEIGESVFSECKSLRRVEIPSTVKIIGKSAFMWCEKLSVLKLAEGIEEIGESAFHYTNLSEIDFPKSATTMYETSFEETPFMANLNQKIQDEKDQFDYYIVNGNLLVANEYEYNPENGGYEGKKLHKIPDNVKRILCGIGNIQTKEIDIPSRVEYMVSVWGSFAELKLPSGLKHIDGIESSVLTSLNLPEGLEELPEIYCGSLTSLTVPANITRITRQAPFSGCSNLKKLVIKGKVTYLPQRLLAYTQVTSFKIPDTVEVLNNINAGTELDSVVIPAGVKTIHWMDDYNLKNLELEEGYNEFLSIDFSRCSNLVNVKLPDSMTRIPSGIFVGCTSLKKITLPKNLQVIEYMAFTDTGITDITIPKGCEFIEPGAFDRGTTLRIHKDSKLLERVKEYEDCEYKIVKYK